MDPYAVLKVPRDISDEALKRNFYYIASMYHPDKGGNEKMYKRFAQAYKLIKKERKQKKSDMFDLSDVNRTASEAKPEAPCMYQPSDFEQEDGSFATEMFNSEFNKAHNRKIKPVERDQKKYHQEYQRVSAEAQSIQPVFGARGLMAYDNHTFNHLFNQAQHQHQKKTGEVEEVFEEPKVLGATGVTEYVDFQPDKEQIIDLDGQATVFQQRAFNAMSKNPKKVSTAVLHHLQQQPNITTVHPMTKREQTQRINAWYEAAAN